MEALLEIWKDRQLVIDALYHGYQPFERNFYGVCIGPTGSNAVLQPLQPQFSVVEKLPLISFNYSKDDPRIELIRSFLTDHQLTCIYGSGTIIKPEWKFAISHYPTREYKVRKCKPECEERLAQLCEQGRVKREAYIAELTRLSQLHNFSLILQDNEGNDFVSDVDQITQNEIDECYYEVTEYRDGYFGVRFAYFGTETRARWNDRVKAEASQEDWDKREDGLKNSALYDYLCEHMPEIAAKVREVYQ